MTCIRCLESDPAQQGVSPSRCAFVSEVFSSDNWNCATMNALRRLAIWSYRDDLGSGSISVIPLPDTGDLPRGYIVLGYYKERGAVGSAVVVGDEASGPLTVSVAETTINWEPVEE